MHFNIIISGYNDNLCWEKNCLSVADITATENKNLIGCFLLEHVFEAQGSAFYAHKLRSDSAGLEFHHNKSLQRTKFT